MEIKELFYLSAAVIMLAGLLWDSREPNRTT